MGFEGPSQTPPEPGIDTPPVETTRESPQQARERMVENFGKKAEASRDLERQATTEIDSVHDLSKDVRTMIEEDDSFKSYTDREKEYYAHKLSPKDDVLSVVDGISTASSVVKEMLPDYGTHTLDKKSEMDRALEPLYRYVHELQFLHGRTGVDASPEANKKIIEIRERTDNLRGMIYRIENMFAKSEQAE